MPSNRPAARKAAAALAAGLLAALAACTHVPTTEPDTRSYLELRAAMAAAHAARIHGPREVRLAGRMMLRLQEGLVYIPPAQGERLLRAVGKIPRQRLLGVLVVGASDTTWVAVLYAREQGMPGIPELDVAGWDHVPALAGLRLW